MKKLLLIVGMALFLTGCGANTSSDEPEGVILDESAVAETSTAILEGESTEAETVSEEIAEVEDDNKIEAESKEDEIVEEPEEEAAKPIITLYKDEASGKYGYNSDGQPMTEPIYAHAEEFIDGYAVVYADSLYDGSEVIDESMNVVLTNETGIFNYGHGFFGMIQDFRVYAEGYNRVKLVNAQGVDLLNQSVFEVDVYDETLILVADHLKGWLIDGEGQPIKADIIDPKLVETYDVAEIIDGNFVLYMDGFDKTEYIVIDAGGAVLESTVSTGGGRYTDIGDGYDVKHKVILDKRFVKVTIPEISLSGDTSPFSEANEWFENIYDPQSYLDLSVDEMYDEYELNFEARRIGNVLEVDISYYWYGFGAAHPNYAMETYQLNLIDGTAQDITELFSDGMIFDTLTRMVRDIAKEDDDGYFDVNEIIVGANTSYRITPEAITFYYSPYEIGPYAMGIPEFEIAFSALDGYMNLESSYYKSLMSE